MQMTMAIALFTGRIEALWLLIAEMLYVYNVVLRFGKGLPRLLLLLPLVPPSLFVPWTGPTGPERALLSFVFLWIVMFRLLLLAWDVGPAADPLALSSFPRFFSAMTFSLHLKREKGVYVGKQETAIVDSVVGEDADGRRTSLDSEGVVSNGVVRKRNAKAGAAAAAAAAAGKSSGVRVDDGRPQVSAGEKVHSKYTSWIEMVATSQAGYIVVLRSAFYFIVSASLVRVLVAWRHLMTSDYVLDLLLGFLVYFACLFLFEATAGIPACVLGVQVHPQFNMPFLADSLADFWGRRWNMFINNLLRVSVYDPLLGFVSGGKKPSQGERVLSIAATFLVSGLTHEIIFFYLNQSRPSWEMTMFFVVNGVATIVEGAIIQSRTSFSLPRLVRRAYTLGFVYLSACWFFFPPLLRTGMLDQCLEELFCFTYWVQGFIIPQQYFK